MSKENELAYEHVHVLLLCLDFSFKIIQLHNEQMNVFEGHLKEAKEKL